jgi:hypothetical protein
MNIQMNEPHGINIDTARKKFKITKLEFEVRMFQDIVRKMLEEGGVCLACTHNTYYMILIISYTLVKNSSHINLISKSMNALFVQNGSLQ